MGIFDAIGSVIAGGLGFLGGERQNSANQKISREQMAFQQQNSDTAYQRAADDLEKAGLNRILALGSPSSTPSGAGIPAQNSLEAGVSSALEFKRLSKELDVMDSQITKNYEDAKNANRLSEVYYQQQRGMEFENVGKALEARLDAGPWGSVTRGLNRVGPAASALGGVAVGASAKAVHSAVSGVKNVGKSINVNRAMKNIQGRVPFYQRGK